MIGARLTPPVGFKTADPVGPNQQGRPTQTSLERGKNRKEGLDTSPSVRSRNKSAPSQSPDSASRPGLSSPEGDPWQ